MSLLSRVGVLLCGIYAQDGRKRTGTACLHFITTLLHDISSWPVRPPSRWSEEDDSYNSTCTMGGNSRANLLVFRPACNRRSFSNVSVSVRILFAEIVTCCRQASPLQQYHQAHVLYKFSGIPILPESGQQGSMLSLYVEFGPRHDRLEAAIHVYGCMSYVKRRPVPPVKRGAFSASSQTDR